MDEQFTERLATIADLSDADIATFEDELTAAFDAADAAGDLDGMQAIADALDAVREELARRGTAGDAPAEEPAAEAEVPVAASAATATDVPSTDSPEAGDDEGDDKSDDGDDAAEDESENGDDPQTDTTSPDEGDDKETTVDELTADDVPEANAPSPAESPAVTIRAGGDIPGITAGTKLSGMDDVIDALTRKVDSMRGISGDGEQIIVASLRVEEEVPDERVLRPGDLNGNSRKIRELIADPEKLTPQALTAAGWCAPPSPVYDVPTVGTTDRPIRDAIPTFTADRGGIVWMQPPALPNAVNGSGVWKYDDDDEEWKSYSDATATTETNPANTKPCVYVPCGEEASAFLAAYTQCLCFDNMTARAFPEWIRANTDLTMVAQARFAEQALLHQLFTAAGAADTVTPTSQYGVARDLLTMIRLIGAQFRWRYRLSRTQPLQWVAPAWLYAAIQDDLTLQQPGDATLSVSTAEIDGYLADANIQPIWYIDDAPGTEAFNGYDGFPTVADWVLFPTGTFTRLDGGSLDLGITRSKEDIQQNRYCQFAETFEALAYMGPADSAYAVHGQTPVNILGAHTGGFDPGAAES